MKYKVGDIVWGLSWDNYSGKPPRTRLLRHKITEIVEDFPSAPYVATCPNRHRGSQFHYKSVSSYKNEEKLKAIKILEKEIKRLKKEVLCDD